MLAACGKDGCVVLVVKRGKETEEVVGSVKGNGMFDREQLAGGGNWWGHKRPDRPRKAPSAEFTA